MTEVFTYAFALGLAFNAAPGVVFAESLRRGVRAGFKPALAVQLGSLVGDAAWAVLGLAGAGALFQLPATRVPIAVAGSGVLIWLGWQALSDAPTAIPPDRAEGAGALPVHTGALAAGAALSLGNPLNVVYWSGAAGTVAAVLGETPSGAHLATFFLGFMASSVAWCFACAGMIAVVRRTIAVSLVRGLEVACGLALLGFGGVLLGRTLLGAL